MSVTPLKLSASTNGRGIVITSTTAASGTLLHTTATATGVSKFDEVYVYAQNLTSVVKTLTVNAGGVVSGDRIAFQVPVRANGLYLMVPGLRYNGAVTIRAYATAASKVAVHGYVNRNV